VEHPDDDETVLVRRGQLLVLIVPLDHDDVVLMALEVLVHGKISTALALAGLELEDFKETLVTTSGQVSLLLVPAHHV
jgi:hypothetical protein